MKGGLMMAVSDQKVLRKMMNELQLAMEDVDNVSKMKGHVRSIQILCDLLLDEESSTDEKVVLTKMKEQIVKPSTIEENKGEIDHDGANGPSIFDF